MTRATTDFRAYYQGKSQRPVEVRRISWDVSQDGLPRCAWCRRETCTALADVVQQGFSRNYVATVCYCEWCEKGTVALYDLPLEDESEVNIDYNKT